MQQQNRITAIYLGVLALILGLVITLPSMQLGMDSVWYIVYANSWRLTQQLSALITANSSESVITYINQWPPLYPLWLSLADTPEIAARIINILGLAVSGWMTYAIGLRLGLSWIWALGAAHVVLFAPLYVSTFGTLMTEAPFAPVGLLILWLSLRYQTEYPVGWATPVLLALLIGTAVSLRYVGVGLALFALLVITEWAWRTSHPRRWLHIPVVMVGLIPLVLNILYLLHLTGTATGQQTASDPWHFTDLYDLPRALLPTIFYGIEWLFNVLGLQSRWTLLITVGILGILAILWGWRRRISLKFQRPVRLVAFYIICNLGIFMVLAMRSYVIISIDQRHYAVILPAIMLLLIWGMWRLQLPRIVTGGIGILIVLGAVSGISQLRTNGVDFNPNYSTVFWRQTLADRIRESVVALSDDMLVLTMHVGYFNMITDNRYPSRMFSLQDLDTTACDEMVYPEGYHRLLLLGLDEPIQRELSPDELRVRLTQWTDPCAEVTDITLEPGMIAVSASLR